MPTKMDNDRVILILVLVDGQDILVYGPAILIFFETILPLFGAPHTLSCRLD
jgi:hypothetical protein